MSVLQKSKVADHLEQSERILGQNNYKGSWVSLFADKKHSSQAVLQSKKQEIRNIYVQHPDTYSNLNNSGKVPIRDHKLSRSVNGLTVYDRLTNEEGYTGMYASKINQTKSQPEKEEDVLQQQEEFEQKMIQESLVSSKREKCKALQGETAYDRMTNPKGFTGIHQYRRKDNHGKLQKIQQQLQEKRYDMWNSQIHIEAIFRQ